ncbi:hypothetical protein MNV49_002845 [Pseudohyphozyma bogoriensis]|nr:hypothetical protein MNV49_002845 [Pseudohyphozyma bogoriensis]
MYCSTVGVGCVKPKRPLGGVARSVKVQAMQAMDLFQSVLALGGPDGVGTNLHHVALWELAVAVEHTSGLEDRDFLGKQLHVLGDMTRDVKDEVIRLNSQGISSFTWIVHEFTRIEDLLARPQPPSEDFLQNSLTKLYQKISSDLTLLLSSLDRALPLADRASALGGRVGSALAIEYSRVQREKEEIPVWRGLVERNSWKGKQLRRDLELAGGSVEWVKDVRRDLEDTRSGFVEYAANVGHFKAGVVGYHLSGHGLSTEEEVDSLKGVMSEFRAVLEEVKQNSRAGRGRESKREIDADAA